MHSPLSPRNSCYASRDSGAVASGAVELGGTTVLLTGASGGIGQAVARALHGRGARVLLSGRSTGALEHLRAELGDNAEVLEADLTEAGGWASPCCSPASSAMPGCSPTPGSSFLRGSAPEAPTTSRGRWCGGSRPAGGRSTWLRCRFASACWYPPSSRRRR